MAFDPDRFKKLARKLGTTEAAFSAMGYTISEAKVIAEEYSQLVEDLKLELAFDCMRLVVQAARGRLLEPIIYKDTLVGYKKVGVLVASKMLNSIPKHEAWGTAGAQNEMMEELAKFAQTLRDTTIRNVDHS